MTAQHTQLKPRTGGLFMFVYDQALLPHHGRSVYSILSFVTTCLKHASRRVKSLALFCSSNQNSHIIKRTHSLPSRSASLGVDLTTLATDALCLAEAEKCTTTHLRSILLNDFFHNSVHIIWLCVRFSFVFVIFTYSHVLFSGRTL